MTVTEHFRSVGNRETLWNKQLF